MKEHLNNYLKLYHFHCVCKAKYYFSLKKLKAETGLISYGVTEEYLKAFGAGVLFYLLPKHSLRH